MALIKCPECGKDISEYAEKCIFCGYPLARMKGVTSSITQKKQTNYNIGDIIRFGSYYFDNSESKQPIEWFVIDKKDNEVLLISRYGLDSKQYHQGGVSPVIWETSFIRRWLNKTFLECAFSSEEQRKIKSTIISPEVPVLPDGFRTNDTADKIFLLNITEIKRYLTSIDLIRCKPTQYAISKKAYVNMENGACWWWLRSSGDNFYRAAIVDCDDDLVHKYGTSVDAYSGCIRPAIWMSFENDTSSLERSISSEFKTVKFGSYWQNSNEKTQIEWYVLDHKNDYSVLISKYGLIAQPINTKNDSITWENSTLRNWLNNNFYFDAFTQNERKKILPAKVQNVINQSYNTSSGNDTVDMVHILSAQDANYYFKYEEARKCLPTAYALKSGSYFRENYTLDGKPTCIWWLRTPGNAQNKYTYVTLGGDVFYLGANVDSNTICIRPVILKMDDDKTADADYMYCHVIYESDYHRAAPKTYAFISDNPNAKQGDIFELVDGKHVIVKRVQMVSKGTPAPFPPKNTKHIYKIIGNINTINRAPKAFISSCNYTLDNHSENNYDNDCFEDTANNDYDNDCFEDTANNDYDYEWDDDDWRDYFGGETLDEYMDHTEID